MVVLILVFASCQESNCKNQKLFGELQNKSISCCEYSLSLLQQFVYVRKNIILHNYHSNKFVKFYVRYAINHAMSKYFRIINKILSKIDRLLLLMYICIWYNPSQLLVTLLVMLLNSLLHSFICFSTPCYTPCYASQLLVTFLVMLLNSLLHFLLCFSIPCCTSCYTAQPQACYVDLIQDT